jgi:glycogen synthase
MLKKLLMTADAVGGVWTYALELCRALRPHGVEVALATMGQPLAADQQREAKSLPNVRLFESAFRLEWMDEPWDDVAMAGEWLLRIRDRFQPDLVHLNGYVHGALAWHLPVLVVGHSCVFSWHRAVHGELPPPQRDTYRDQVTRGLRAANYVVAPSKTMLDSLNEFYGPLAAASVVANGRDPEHFRVGKKLPIILSAGRLWDPAKNTSVLVDIAEQLSWPMHLAGDRAFGSPEGPGDGSSSSLKVRYLGRLAPGDLAEWMARAAIFVLPARYEPFGLTVLEAALSGCALVLGDIPSLRENWDGAAVFVSPDDGNQIRSVLQELIRDAQRLQALAHRGRERAAQFTADNMADGYRRIYTTLCGSFSSITR